MVWDPIGQEEEISCCGCDGTVNVLAYNLCGYSVHPYLPPGWLVMDSYPPGDMGLFFWCGVPCMRKNGYKFE